MQIRGVSVALILVFTAGTGHAADTWWTVQRPPVPKPLALAKANAPKTWSIDQICDGIKAAADQYGLPREFFARLIYKESRFDIKAISPVGAQGIAQFMPGTAQIRGLADPWDPAQALPASASFLADLKQSFGKWGLAAAAYNGGPGRVERFIAGSGWLPAETRDYVQSITYRPAEWFLKAENRLEPRPLDPQRDFDEACRRIPIIPTRATLSASASYAPWGVQVAQGRSRSAALKSFSRMRRQYRAVLGGRSALVFRTKVAGIRRYVARVGAPSRVAARKLCARLRLLGGPCVIRKN
ncbi:MAG: lytic transglycosylase domain-containing protein [Pseudomonadota bacterium]